MRAERGRPLTPNCPTSEAHRNEANFTIEPPESGTSSAPNLQNGNADNYHLLSDTYENSSGDGTALAEPLSICLCARPTERGQRPSSGKKRRPRGSKGLAWSEVKFLSDAAARLERAGYRFNVMATVKGDDSQSLQSQKREISRAIAHLGRTIVRKEFPHVGVTVYERRPHDPMLHAHHLVWVPPSAMAALQRFARASKRNIHLSPAGRQSMAYITKQRRPLPPSFEKLLHVSGRGRQKSDFISGVRFSITGAAKALLENKL